MSIPHTMKNYVLYSGIVCHVDMVSICVYSWTMKVSALYKRLGATIKAQRRALGLTQQQLAKQLRISRASLANVETGRQRVLVHQLYELADQLNVNVQELLPEPSEAEALQALDDLLFSENVTVAQRQQIATLLKDDALVASASGGPHDSVPQHNNAREEPS